MVYREGIASILYSKEDIQQRVEELAAAIAEQYSDLSPGEDVLVVGVLKGAVFFMTDLVRALPFPVRMEFMVVSSYGSGTSSSGIVRILKGLDQDIQGRHVLIVEDIIDSGLTLSWLVRNLAAMKPASLSIVTLLRKPQAKAIDVELAHVGFDIPDTFVVGYGLDDAERYRNLPYIGTLKPEAITD